MKRTIQIISSLLFLLIGISPSSAQQSIYTRQPGHWTIGINGGLAYQSSDVPLLLDGYGGGLTLAKNLYYEPGAPLAFDLRGRALYTRSYGLGHTRSYGIKFNDALNGTDSNANYSGAAGGPGFVFHNNRTDLAELGLEGVITFNRLREQKKIILALYGGIGLDWYKTKIDQLDDQGTYATAYEGLDTMRSVSSRRNQLQNNILDGEYETNAHSFNDGGKLRIMPSLGIELGYEFNPRFSMGIGHRVTFARNDILDGHQWNNDQSLTGNNDIHHYTSLHMRWIVDPAPPRQNAPEIIITEPRTNPYSSPSPNAFVAARIKHVNSAMDIDARFNGRRVDFSFDRERFSSNVILDVGRNEFVITATNAVGRDQKQVILLYQDAIIDDTPGDRRRPEVNITNPPNDRYRTNEENFQVRASVLEVRNKEDIRFIYNGRSVRNFDFNPSSGSFRANVRLSRGENDIQITALNEVGRDEDRAVVIFEERFQEQPPRVRITRPNSNPYRTNSPSIPIEARIDNVDRKENIRYQLNGNSLRNFNYDRNYLMADARLRPGRNELLIAAFNDAGEDRAELVIYYDEPIVDPPVDIRAPEVDITRPGSYSTTTNSDRQRIEATIRNVDRKSQIRFIVNGRTNNDFSFNPSRDFFSADIRLEEGDNRVKIIAENEGGKDEASVRINYEQVNIDPVRPPKVSIRKPSNNTTTDEDRIAVEAKILHVDDKRDVQLLVNGSNVSNFSYGNTVLKANVDLREGSNTIKVIATNDDGRDEAQVNVTYKAPVVEEPRPPVVRITAPSNNSTTQNPDTELIARISNVSDKRDIQVSLNGQSISNFSFSSSSGQLTLDLRLREGANTIKVSASNEDGKDDASVRVTYRPAVVPQPPTVSISAPRNNSTTQKAEVDLKAKITNITDKRAIRVSLNGKSVSRFSFSSNGNLTAALTLKEGVNTIKVSASNDDGKDEDAVRVTYRPAVSPKPPTVNISAPRNNSTTQKAEVDLKAKITNITDKRAIRVSLNGKSVSRFSFSSNGNLTAALTLKEGANTIKVIASNDDGKDEDAVRVTYRPAISPKPPTVNISAPRNNSTTQKAKVDLKAKITNISDKRSIRVSLNGKTVSGFSFSSSSGNLTAALTLKEGANSIKVSVSNENGKDEDAVRVTYKPVVVPTATPPKVSISQPSNNSTSKKARITLQAQVTNVSNKGDIQVSLNGKSTSAFSFNDKTNRLTATLNLKEGSNTIKVSAKNKDGQDSDQVKVTYKIPVEPPQVKISRPKNKSTSTKVQVALKASIKNVNDKKAITVLLNGKKQSFQYKNGSLSANLTLKEGTNSIEVNAKNSAGSDKDKVSVTYKKPRPKPVITYTSPRKPGTKVTKTPFNLVAQIKNVDNTKQLKLLVNGKAMTKFKYDSRKKELTASIKLKKGKNTFRIEASNEAGKTTAETDVRFTVEVPTVPAPSISNFKHSAPTVNPLSPNTARTTVTAQLANITTKSQIRFSNNGQEIKDFTYSSKSKTFSCQVTLTRGDNKIVLKVENETGSDEKTLDITF